MNKPQIIQLDRPKHIRDYPNGPCYKAGTLVTTNADWRTERPIFNADKCNGCYYCYLCCPEGVISKNQSRIEIDFDFCKGCGICANVCPRNAFEMVREDKTK